MAEPRWGAAAGQGHRQRARIACNAPGRMSATMEPSAPGTCHRDGKTRQGSVPLPGVTNRQTATQLDTDTGQFLRRHMADTRHAVRHNPTRDFLPIISHRCKKLLAIKGEVAYQEKQTATQTVQERQL
jgi:hypothetical protein